MMERSARLSAVISLLLVSCANVSSVSSEQTPIPETFTPSAEAVEVTPFNEALQKKLEEWLANQNYDYGYNEPLIKYSKMVYEADNNGGWNVAVETADGSRQEMFTVNGTGATFQVDGETKTVAVDRIYAPAEADEGGYFRLRIKEGEEGDPAYMWRYPWGGWVVDDYKTFTENGVSIIANEANLYGGLFSINPEQVEDYWEKTVSGLFFVQEMTDNRVILNKYPDLKAFLTAARSGILFIGLRVFAAYPDPENDPSHQFATSWKTIESEVDLSALVYAIPEVRSPVLAGLSQMDTDYFWFDGSVGQGQIDPITQDERVLLQIRLRRSVTSFVDSERSYLPSLEDSNVPQANFEAATQLLKRWTYETEHLYQRWKGMEPYVYQDADLAHSSYYNDYPYFWTIDTHPGPRSADIGMLKTENSLLLLRP